MGPVVTRSFSIPTLLTLLYPYHASGCEASGQHRRKLLPARQPHLIFAKRASRLVDIAVVRI